ncbi:MAG: hypothetical protein IPL96_13330 [Holophagaceae bacterium]|nr:hypothetical protein [Holophagaceae bacterium]
MPPRPRPFLLDTLIRGVRFFYLLWGGMLLTTLSLYDRLKLPPFLWSWPKAARFLTSSWGRGIALGLGLVMAIAALVEIWHLVDRLLVMATRDSEHD